jgi:isopenicillin-N epimerase
MDDTDTPSDLQPHTDQFWAAIRRDQFYLDPDTTFLQGGSVGPSPKPVVDKVTESIKAFDSDPLKHQPLYGPMVSEAREKLAAFIGTRPERVALVQNTTMGMSVPAQGLTWKAGGEILMTDQEYGAVNACWDYIAERYGLTVRRVELPLEIRHKDQIIDTFKAGLNNKTQAMVFGHVYWSTGLATPVKELTELGRNQGAWVIVDGAHATSMVPLHLDDWNPHFYTSSLHKWTLAPKGTGFLYVSDDAQSHVEPLILGGNARPDAPQDASKFDMMGTRDQTPFIGLGTALDFQAEIGWEHIRTYCQGLAGYLKERIKRIRGGRVLTPTDPEMSGFITTFTIDGADLYKIRQELWDDEKIETSAFSVKDIPVFRISTHFYNSRDDIDRMIREIERRL